MLLEKRKSISNLGAESLREIADYLCHGEPIVRPIFECVKVFVRIHESGSFTYARHPYDLGTKAVHARDISSRMNCQDRAEVVQEALEQLEEQLVSSWPFSPGSSSWTLIEILHPDIRIAGCENSPAIIFRKAVRLNHRGEHSATALTEKIFSSFESILKENNDDLPFDMVFDPQLRLENISGTGTYSEFIDSLEGMNFLADGKDISLINGLNSYYAQASDKLVEDICSSNFGICNKTNPGFYFSLAGNDYVVRPKSFQHNKRIATEEKKQKKPLSIFGMIR